MSLAWIYMLIAGVCEIGFAVGLKLADGFTRAGASAMTVAFAIVSFTCLSLALREIPIGTGYAVWTGIGAAGTAIYGMAFFGDSRDPARIFCIALIVLGVLGLKFSSSPNA